MSEPLIRDARHEDLARIDEIYNHYVRTSTCTMQYEPTTPEERRAWFEAHGEKHPVLVALQAGRVVGWGALSRFHARAGYASTVENAVYVAHDQHRRGIGRALLAALVARAGALGYRTILAAIAADQDASLALHAAFGFVETARLRNVGYKLERWLDVVYLQKFFY